MIRKKIVRKTVKKIKLRFVQKMRKKPILRKRKVNSLKTYFYNSKKMKERKLYLKYSKLFSCHFLYSEYKSSTHKNNCTKYKLCKDMEKNPGPVIHHVDHYKTIKAPYSQADVAVFGQNTGLQCVPMSLCALIYNNVRGIRNSDDLKQIMHIGNQLYSTLSRLAGQSFLQLTELPTMLTVFDENYQLEYSETYTGDVHGESTIEGYQYCTSLERAFESLISEQFRSFILIVDCIAVGIIYCADNGYYRTHLETEKILLFSFALPYMGCRNSTIPTRDVTFLHATQSAKYSCRVCC